jgi:hypothetical protein
VCAVTDINEDPDGIEIGQITVGFRKSSHSGTNPDECVEVADLADGGRLLRDSKLGAVSPVLAFTASEWAAFSAGVRAGEFG